MKAKITFSLEKAQKDKLKAIAHLEGYLLTTMCRVLVLRKLREGANEHSFK